MGDYYKSIDNISFGKPADPDDINEIQTNIAAGQAQEIIDLDGESFVYGEDEDAFQLSPVQTLIDQSNEVGSTWLPLRDSYFKQVIHNQKSSFESIYLTLKNDNTTTDIPVTCEIRLFNEDSEIEREDVLKTMTMVVPKNTASTVVEFNFVLDYLQEDDYAIVVKRTNLPQNAGDGVQILSDANATYSTINNDYPEAGKLYTSDNDDLWTPMNSSLWFRQTYATEACLDIKESEALVHGKKVKNINTHIKILPSNGLGDRIDLVAMDSEGIVTIFQGEAGEIPIAPIPEVAVGMLKMAYITIPNNVNISSGFIITQKDSEGILLPRSQEERLRRIQRKMNWIWNYNSPGRIKYNREGPGLAASYDSGIEYDAALGGFKLSDTATNVYSDTYGNTSKIDGTTNCKYSQYSYTLPIVNSRELIVRHVIPSTMERKWFKHTASTTKKRGVKSRYHAGYFIASKDFSITQMDIFFAGFSNVSHIKVFLYETTFNKPSTKKGSIYMGKSNATYPKSQAAFSKEPSGQLAHTFKFTSLINLKKGKEYSFVIVPVPKNKDKVGTVKLATLYDTDDYNRVLSEYAIVGGVFPPKTSPRRLYENKFGGLTVSAMFPEKVAYRVYGNVKEYAKTGFIKSTKHTTSYNITKVRAMMNISLPPETSYKLEVSVNNGVSWSNMTNLKEIPITSPAKDFVYKLTLYSSNDAVTPVIKYDSTSGIPYAIKFELGMDNFTSNNSGQIITNWYDGVKILNEGLGISSSYNKYSHFEWLRFWGQKNAGAITVDIETSDNGSTPKAWKTGMTLSQFTQQNIDYTDYDEPINNMEYNLYTGLQTTNSMNKIAGTAINVAGADQDWVNPGNAVVNDASDATCVLTNGQKTDPLRLTSYGLNIPVNSTILGVTVAIEGSASTNSIIKDFDLSLVHDSATIGTAKGDTTTLWTTTKTMVSYGDESDLWGATLTPSIVNNPTFGVQFRAQAIGSATARVNEITMTIYYAEDSTGTKPMYARYMRFKFNLTRPAGGETQSSVSPIIYKAGVVDMIM